MNITSILRSLSTPFMIEGAGVSVLLRYFGLLCACSVSAFAELAITSHSIDSGGGRSAGGGYTLTGTIGQSDAGGRLSSGSVRLLSGFWRPGSSLGLGYASWAAANIPAGMDDSFDGDWNHDGISNGLDYAFGAMKIANPALGQFTAPLTPTPSDTTLRFLFSTDLLDWDSFPARIEWPAGGPAILQSDVSIEDGIITDLFRGPDGRGFWRFEADLLAP